MRARVSGVWHSNSPTYKGAVQGSVAGRQYTIMAMQAQSGIAVIPKKHMNTTDTPGPYRSTGSTSGGQVVMLKMLET